MALVRRLIKGTPVSAAEYDAVVDQVEKNQNASISQDLKDRIVAFFYTSATANITTTLASAEKGVLTVVRFNYAVSANDDTITSIIFDNELQSETSGSKDYSISNSVTKTLIVRVQNNADITTSKTFPFYVPQFYGTLPENYTEPTWNYANLNSYNKVVQGNSTITVTDDFNNEHFFFILNKENPTLKDVSDFPYIIGDFSSNAYFLTKEITITLANGTTTTAWLFVTRETVNAPSTFKSA